MDSRTDYSRWSNEQLIQRVTQLEARLKQTNAEFSASTSSMLPLGSTSTASPKEPPSKKPKKAANSFDPSKYSTRFIALKFAYLGQRYNGFEHHANNVTPLPTIEEELWKALMKTRLILPSRMNELKEGEIDWEGCEYSKCGRTDKGVSAFGQVIGLRVRSKRPVAKSKPPTTAEENDESEESKSDRKAPSETEETVELEEPQLDSVKDELPYIQLLNRVLPEDIRILAWCPQPPPDFNARFSCKERQYRYFFTNPAFAPVPGDRGISASATGRRSREGWLDIEAMQDAAKRFEGVHDFRNFCKIDSSKQITNFERRIFHASVEKLDPRHGPVGYISQPDFEDVRQEEAANGHARHVVDYNPPAVYSFNVNGSAFLWHQVRHLVAVIFLIGQGLEPPSVVTDLLDSEKTPARPKYEMAQDAPLVLWNCVFAEDRDEDRQDVLHWVHAGDSGGQEFSKRVEAEGGDGKFGRNGIIDCLWSTWRQRKIDEVLAGTLIDVVANQGKLRDVPEQSKDPKTSSTRVFDGGNTPRPVGGYIPIMKKERLEHYEVVNARYLERKGKVEKPSAAGSMDVKE